MKIHLRCVIALITITVAALLIECPASYAAGKIIEKTGTVAGQPVLIQIAPSKGAKDAAAKRAIDEAIKEMTRAEEAFRPAGGQAMAGEASQVIEKCAALSSKLGKDAAYNAITGPASIANGYAIDRAVAVLKDRGFNNALISFDGGMYCLGEKSDKEMWRVAIPHPTDPKKVFAALRLKDKAIYTAHVKPLSATVIGDDAVSAGCLASSLVSMGDAGLAAAESAGLDAILIKEDGETLKTAMAGGFKEQYGKAKK